MRLKVLNFSLRCYPWSMFSLTEADLTTFLKFYKGESLSIEALPSKEFYTIIWSKDVKTADTDEEDVQGHELLVLLYQ